MKCSTAGNILTGLFTWIAISLSFSTSAQNSLFLGMTTYGGSTGGGTIFKFNPSTNTEDVLWNFGTGTDGAVPMGNLVYDADNGLYYGMTSLGGQRGYGTIFSFDPISDIETVVCTLGKSSYDAASPNGSLIYDSGKRLFYGLTSGGGYYSSGTIISFDPATGLDSVLWNFGSGTDGIGPNGDFVYNPSNHLFYGMTVGGGYNNNGTIFSFNINTNIETVEYRFFGGATDGKAPYGNLVMDTANNLFYALTSAGDSHGSGVIFSFDPSLNGENIVWNFPNGPTNADARGSLLYDGPAGLLYGMTKYGGSNGIGCIFSFNPGTANTSTLWNFNFNSGGRIPYGNLTFDPNNGLLYGMTKYGGTDSGGCIITIDPQTRAENVVWNFGGTGDGANPMGSLTIYHGPSSINTINNIPSICTYPNPVTHFLNITGMSEGQKIEIYNDQGQQMCYFFAKHTTEQTDISTLDIGIYLVKILNQDGALILMNKVIKTN